MKSNYQSTPCDNTVNTVQYWLSNRAFQLTRFLYRILQLIYKENRTDVFSKSNQNRTEPAVFLKTEPNLKNPFRTTLVAAVNCNETPLNTQVLKFVGIREFY